MSNDPSAPSRINHSFLSDPGLRAVFDALGGRGTEVRVAGGAVRDAILERTISDVDLATIHIPKTVIERVEAAGLKAIPTGIAHGTVTVAAKGQTYQVTTLRQDVETDGRHAVVAFGADWHADAARRDFTMNALYLNPDGTLFDPLGGLRDCLNQYVRFIGDPTERIREDYLRILRFFRFNASHGNGRYDEKALQAIRQERGGLSQIAPERIGQEMRKLLIAAGAAAALKSMRSNNVLPLILPQVDCNITRFEALRAVLLRFKTPLTAHGLLAGLIPLSNDTDSTIDLVQNALRLTRSESNDLIRLSKPYVLATLPDLLAAREARYRDGRRLAMLRIALAWADANEPVDSHDIKWVEAMNIALRQEDPVFPISGKELMRLGVPPGRAIGDSLAQLEAQWLRNDYQMPDNWPVMLKGR